MDVSSDTTAASVTRGPQSLVLWNPGQTVGSPLRRGRVCRAVRGFGASSASWLRPPRRRGMDRIVRPGMLRVASAHFVAYGGVAAAPEAGQVACGLHRALRR